MTSGPNAAKKPIILQDSTFTITFDTAGTPG